MGRRGLGRGREIGEPGGERLPAGLVAGDDDFRLGFGEHRHGRRHRRQDRGRDDDRARPAVGEHEGKIAGAELGIDGNRHDPGLDRAEKGGRKVDPVMEAQQDPLLALHAQATQQIGETARPIGQFGKAAAPGDRR